LVQRITPVDERPELSGLDQFLEIPDRRLVKLRKSEHDLLASQQRRDDYLCQESQAPFPREIDPARFQSAPASAERALADRVEDHVVFLLLVREVPGRVVDDPVRAQALDELHVRCGADRGHAGTETLQQLDRRRANRPGGAVDEDVLPAPDPCLPDVRERVVRAFGAGSGLLVGQALRDRREWPVSRNREVFGVCAKWAAESAEPEHPVADREGRDTIACRLDFARQTRYPGSSPRAW